LIIQFKTTARCPELTMEESCILRCYILIKKEKRKMKNENEHNLEVIQLANQLVTK
jgi:hypothetical protein